MNKLDIMKAAEKAEKWQAREPAIGDFMQYKGRIFDYVTHREKCEEWKREPDIKQLAAALIAAAELLKQVEWQDIESAPKDGVPFLVIDGLNSREPFIAYYDSEGDLRDRYCATWVDENSVTHWQPLPQPPVIIEKEGV